jgi:hypothetical protein
MQVRWVKRKLIENRGAAVTFGAMSLERTLLATQGYIELGMKSVSGLIR